MHAYLACKYFSFHFAMKVLNWEHVWSSPYNYRAQQSKASLLEASFAFQSQRRPTLEYPSGKHYLAGIPDLQLTTSYSVKHNDSLIEWA